MSDASVIALRCRTSDRTPGGVRGVDALAPRLARLLGVEPRLIGSPGDARPGGFEDALDFLRSQLSIALTTEDIQEGVKAFFEKREPHWTGR